MPLKEDTSEGSDVAAVMITTLVNLPAGYHSEEGPFSTSCQESGRENVGLLTCHLSITHISSSSDSPMKKSIMC